MFEIAVLNFPPTIFKKTFTPNAIQKVIAGSVGNKAHTAKFHVSISNHGVKKRKRGINISNPTIHAPQPIFSLFLSYFYNLLYHKI